MHRLLGAVGGCVERASQVAYAAGPGQFVIDEPTFAALEERRSSFRPWWELDGATSAKGLYLMVGR
jgi:hypothetical protein